MASKKQQPTPAPNAKPNRPASPAASKRWKNGKPPPDHPMWQELWQASERAWTRMAAQGELDNWDKESTSGSGGDFRKGNPRKA